MPRAATMGVSSKAVRKPRIGVGLGYRGDSAAVVNGRDGEKMPCPVVDAEADHPRLFAAHLQSDAEHRAGFQLPGVQPRDVTAFAMFLGVVSGVTGLGRARPRRRARSLKGIDILGVGKLVFGFRGLRGRHDREDFPERCECRRKRLAPAPRERVAEALRVDIVQMRQPGRRRRKARRRSSARRSRPRDASQVASFIESGGRSGKSTVFRLISLSTFAP